MLYKRKSDSSDMSYLGEIRASKGFDRGLEDGEAGRRHALIPKLKLNAEDNLAYAA